MIGQIVGLGHEAQVGKDTAAEILFRYGFARLAFADKLKELALDISPWIWTANTDLGSMVREVGWEEAKGNAEVRKLLQRTGVAARDHLGTDVWVNPVIDQIKQAEMTASFVITDVRFPNEFDRLRLLGGRLIKMVRKGAGAGNHASETALQGHVWDHVIENNGTLEDLEAELVRVLRLDRARDPV